MHIPEDTKNCVAVIGYKAIPGTATLGLYFHYNAESKGVRSFSHYAVTARHVITGIDERIVDGEFRIRVNTNEAGIHHLTSRVDDSYMHPSDDRLGVAVFCRVFSHKLLDWLFWPVPEGFAIGFSSP